MQANMKQWGGTRPGAGRIRQNIKLDQVTAHIVAKKLKQWREERSNPNLTEDDVVRELIHLATATDTQEKQ
jgi:hypothetical protein